jgi:hypothetical protein
MWIYIGGVFKFVIVVVLIAVAIYLLIRVIERRGLARPGDPSGPFGPTPHGPLGPDDDPDFIWGLNKKKRHPDDPGI